jgi:molybdate transport system substrate-binding protein
LFWFEIYDQKDPLFRGNFQGEALVMNKALTTVLACTAYLASNAVDAAEIKILCASGMREVVSELQPQLARIAGQQVSISFGEAGDLRKRLEGGEIADVAILPRIVLDQVAADGNVVPATIIDISQSSIGIGVRKDAPKPDIGSAEQFKQVLLAAKAIVVTDPASGGVAGVHVADVFRRLGIMDQLAPKLRLTRGQRNATFVEKGEADIAVQLSNEIRIVPGIVFIAFPPEFGRTFVFSAALGSNAKEANVARTMLQFLASPETAAVVEAKGMDRAAAK